MSMSVTRKMVVAAMVVRMLKDHTRVHALMGINWMHTEEHAKVLIYLSFLLF